MKFPSHYCLLLLTLCYVSSGCVATSGRSSSVSAEQAGGLAEVCRLINASGASVVRVSAQKFNGPSAWEGVATRVEKQFSSSAEIVGSDKIKLRARDRSGVRTEYVRPRVSVQQPAPYRSESVGTWTIPINAITEVQISKFYDDDSLSTLNRSDFGGGYVAAHEVVKNCYNVSIVLSRKVRYENRDRDPELSWSKSFAGGHVAHFDNLSEAEHLAEKLRHLAGIN